MVTVMRWVVLAVAILATPVVANAQVGGKFEVFGEMQNREENGFLLWGRAISKTHGMAVFGTVSEPGHILIVNIEPVSKLGFHGFVCFKAKHNPGPVWVYGPCPDAKPPR